MTLNSKLVTIDFEIIMSFCESKSLTNFSQNKMYICSTIPDWLLWMKFLSPWYYGNEAMEITQWRNEEKIPCEADDNICLDNGDKVLEYYSMDKVFHHFFGPCSSKNFYHRWAKFSGCQAGEAKIYYLPRKHQKRYYFSREKI